MPAPLVGFVIAFLTGAALPEATLGSAAQAVIVVDQKATTVYAGLPAICGAIGLALNRRSGAADVANASSRWRRALAVAADRLARDADIVCRDAKAPNTPVGRLKAAADALADIARADNLIPPTKAPTR